MLYLIQWGDNMAYSSNFQKGLMMGLAMGGLSISKKNAEVIEVEKPVYIDRPINFSAIGRGCPEAHCFNSHAWLAFGDIPEHDAPSYADIRNRSCSDGTEWLNSKTKEFFNSKL